MAIKDSNVLNRLNTLNTNLENGDVAKVEENISKRLFWVLEWVNNISVDSELYASINNVANASDIGNFINTEKTKLSNTYTQIPYSWWAFDVLNSVVTLAPGTTIADTQTAMTNMNNVIAGLNTLPSKINTLRSRFEENRRILNDVYNIQLDWRRTWRTTTDINNDITTETWNRNKCNNLLSILSRIQTAEQHPAYSNPAHAQHAYYQALHTNEVNNFNVARVGILTSDYAGDWDFAIKRSDVMTAQNAIDTNIRNLQQELRLSEDAIRNINRLATWTIAVPNDLWLFNANDTIVNKTILTNSTNTQIQINNIDQRLGQLETLQWQIENLRARYQDNLDKLKKILALQQLEQRMNTTHPWEMIRRQNEFTTIRDISNSNLLLWNAAYDPELPNQTINVWWILWPVALNFINWALWTWFNGWARTSTYSLCDEVWNPLKNNAWKLEIQQWWQTISLWWISFDNVAQTMTINNLQVTPIEWVTFPLVLDLNVRVRVHDNDTWLDIDHHKPIHIEITRPTLDHTARENAYDRLTPPMNERVESEYTNKYREELENEAIWSILREWWNEKEVDEIYNNEMRREAFITDVRRSLVSSWNIPFLELAILQSWFRTDMTREDRDVPVQYLLWENQFQNYIRQNIPENLKNYASKTIKDNANIQRDTILQEFLNFQTNLKNKLVDYPNNFRVFANVPPESEWPEWHPHTFWQRLTWRWSVQNNYTKFFQWRHAELKDLSLETDNWTIKYWVKVEVSWVNKITATIDIDWKDEPEIIDAPNHDELMRWILNMTSTKDGESVNKKLLCNIAVSVLKAMVLMSPQRLNRQIPPTDFLDNKWNTVSCDRIEAFVKWWNLKIRWWGVDWSRTRHNVTIFDEAQFREIHDDDMLENWIYELSTQINTIMNATAQEYHEATSAMLRNDGNRYVMRYNTAERFRWWPIKRLWWRMVHGKTSNDFNFDNITVNEAWKTVNIKLNKWLFTVSGTHEWKNFEYKSRNLWSILRKKIGRDYVFNGVELAMVAAINEAFIQKLRKNHWVATENFVISDVNDGKTWRTYIFDSAWNLSYLEIEDVNLNPLGAGQTWRIDPNQIPTARRRCNEQERKEFMQNPLLAGRLQRAMRRRLALF